MKFTHIDAIWGAIAYPPWPLADTKEEHVSSLDAVSYLLIPYMSYIS